MIAPHIIVSGDWNAVPTAAAASWHGLDAWPVLNMLYKTRAAPDEVSTRYF